MENNEIKDASKYLGVDLEKKNSGFHAGDLGKSEWWGNQVGSNRGSGHFGTGTYLVGHHEQIDKYNDNRTKGPAPHFQIDMSSMNNLYKPKNRNHAQKLHDNLKILNNYFDELNQIDTKSVDDFEDPDDYYKYKNFVPRMSKFLNKTPEEINNALLQVRKKWENPPADFREELKTDSPSTIFMKALGYGGVDVRHIKSFDNTGFGSVIYDLDKQYAKQINPGHEYDIEYDADDNFNEDDINDWNKRNQLDLIRDLNPAPNETNAWIRSVDDIQTFQEAISDRNAAFFPDFTESDAKKAAQTGKIRIYSSHPIKPGVWVTPSKMEAQNYGGNYYKDVNISDIAWLDSGQGMYANMDEYEKIKNDRRNEEEREMRDDIIKDTAEWLNKDPNDVTEQDIKNYEDYWWSDILDGLKEIDKKYGK